MRHGVGSMRKVHNAIPRGTPSGRGGLFAVDFPADQQLFTLESIFDWAPIGLCILDLDFRYVAVNQHFSQMYRLPIKHFIGNTVLQALPGPASQIISHLELALAEDGVVEAEISLTFPPEDDRTGQPEDLIYLRTAQPIRDASGKVAGLSVALIDITERKRIERALRESEANLSYTVELNPHIPWMADPSGELISMSPRWNTLTGRSSGEVLLKIWHQALHPDDRLLTLDAWNHAVQTGEPYDREYRVNCADATWRWVRARAYPRRDSDGNVVRWYGTVEDIHDRKITEAALQTKTAKLEKATEALAKIANEDHLTGLANRRHFDNMLRREIERARRFNLPLALVLIDVDHFKQFNDILGHIAGDECLQGIALAIRGAIRRPGDLAARFGGEEFAVLLPGTSSAGAMQVTTDINEAIRNPKFAHHDDRVAPLTISAGVAMLELGSAQDGPALAMMLLKAADLALYEAKSKGRNKIVFST